MEKEFYNTYFETEKDHWWFKVRRIIILKLLKKYLSKEPANSRILDFGCGSGYLVNELAKLGYQAFGVDNYAPAIEFGKQRGIQNLSVAGEGEDLKIEFDDNSFDALLALDVVEHIKNDSIVIKEIERVLKPGGVAFITVPAYNWLWGLQDEVAHHYRRYTAGQMKKLVRKNTKLHIVFKSYFNFLLFIPIAVVRLVSKVLKLKDRESDFDIASPFINSLLFSVFNMEAALIDPIRYPFGVSILFILKK